MANTAIEAFQAAVEANLAGRADASVVAAINEGLTAGCEEIANAWEWRELGTRIVSGVTNTNAGTWAAGAAYVVGDVAYDDTNETYYRCIKALPVAGTYNTLTLSIAGDDEDNWAASTVEAHAQGTLPSDVGEVLGVTLVDGAFSYPVVLKTREWVEAHYPVADQFSPNKPAVCYREGDLLFYAPEPNDTYTVRIVYDATLTLATAEASKVSSTGFDHLLIAYATAHALESLEHGDRSAARWWAIFERRMERKKRKQGSGGERQAVDTRRGGGAGTPTAPLSTDAARCTALGYSGRTEVSPVTW